MPIAHVTIKGITPYTASRYLTEPKLSGESVDDYDKRVWRAKMLDHEGIAHIPGFGFSMATMTASKRLGRIPGKGQATWYPRFMSGIATLEDLNLGVKVSDLESIVVFVNPQGMRGGGKRVPKCFPIIQPGWEAIALVQILDPEIPEDMFRKAVDLAGKFVGLGQYRVERGGTNGRFIVTEFRWEPDEIR